MRLSACLAGILFTLIDISGAGSAPLPGADAGGSDFWKNFASGLALEAAVVLPSNPWVTDVSVQRYGVGVLAAAAASYASARLWDDRGVSFWSALHGAAVGGAVGGFLLFLAKKLDFPTRPENLEESYFRLDPAPWNLMLYGSILVAPPLGAALGLRHHVEAALIEWEQGRMAFGLPAPRMVPEPGCPALPVCSFALLRIRLDQPCGQGANGTGRHGIVQ